MTTMRRAIVSLIILVGLLFTLGPDQVYHKEASAKTLSKKKKAPQAQKRKPSSKTTIKINSKIISINTNTAANNSPQPIAGTLSGKAITIQYTSERKAIVSAWENGNLVKQFTAFGPQPRYKKLKGTYRITYQINPLHSTKYGPYDLSYWMTIKGNYGFHGHKINRNTGQQEPDFSHGCIAMDHIDAAWLYSWTPVGTPVNLHD